MFTPIKLPKRFVYDRCCVKCPDELLSATTRRVYSIDDERYLRRWASQASVRRGEAVDASQEEEGDSEGHLCAHVRAGAGGAAATEAER